MCEPRRDRGVPNAVRPNVPSNVSWKTDMTPERTQGAVPARIQPIRYLPFQVAMRLTDA